MGPSSTTGIVAHIGMACQLQIVPASRGIVLVSKLCARSCAGSPNESCGPSCCHLLSTPRIGTKAWAA